MDGNGCTVIANAFYLTGSVCFFVGTLLNVLGVR